MLWVHIMILGVGTDIIQTSRFKSWRGYSNAQLLRVFSEYELEYCMKSGVLDLQCLASRFAVKEAFFKAFSAALIKLGITQQTFSFLFACQNVEVIKGAWDIPELKVDWVGFGKKIGEKLPKLNVDLSISHEEEYAICFVVISSQ